MQGDTGELPPTPHSISRKTVEQWFGFEPDKNRFTATIGTDIGFVSEFFKTGFMPSYPPEMWRLPYHKDLSNHGSHLYYVTYVYSELARRKPQIAQEMKQLMRPEWTDSYIRKDLSFENTRRVAKKYAFRQAVRYAFKSSTGISADEYDALLLSYILEPKQFNERLESLWSEEVFNGGLTDIEREANQEIVSSILEKFGRKALLDIVSDCMSRRGVVIYFNEQIYQHAHPGVEDHDEIMLVARSPLTERFVRGIEPFTPHEKEKLLQLVGK